MNGHFFVVVEEKKIEKRKIINGAFIVQGIP